MIPGILFSIDESGRDHHYWWLFGARCDAVSRFQYHDVLCTNKAAGEAATNEGQVGTHPVMIEISALTPPCILTKGGAIRVYNNIWKMDGLID